MAWSEILCRMAAGNGPALIAYPDASLVVATLAEESGSARADTWLAQHLNDLAASDWLDLEIASALAAKARNDDISSDQHGAARDYYAQVVATSAQRLSIKSKTFGRAAAMITLADSLRAGDALHLAIAEAHGATLFTMDVSQAEAGRKLGVPIMLV